MLSSATCVISASENIVTNETLTVKAPTETLRFNASHPERGDKTVDEPIQLPTNGREGIILSHTPEWTYVQTSNRTTEISPNIKSTTSTITNESVNNHLNITTKSSVETPSKISARKGVTLPELAKTGSTISVVKKPTITENSDEDNHSEPNRKSSENVNGKEFLLDNREHKRAAYLIPIIAVIFSVPLVAVIISVLYKRGSEWWQHRHYRRMDFLIEGMYNN